MEIFDVQVQRVIDLLNEQLELLQHREPEERIVCQIFSRRQPFGWSGKPNSNNLANRVPYENIWQEIPSGGV
jgi:hypothetical protein